MLYRDTQSKSGSPAYTKGRNCSTTMARRYLADRDAVSRSMEVRKDQRTWRFKGRQSCCASTCQRSRPTARRARHWLFAQIGVEQGNTEMVIGLIPARPDTHYWHRDIAGAASIFFLKGRLKFGNVGQPAPFPSCLVVWGGSDEVITAIQAAIPEAWLSR